MTAVIGDGIAFALFLIVTALIALIMLVTWDTQIGVHKALMRQQEERLTASIGIQSTADTSTNCLSYTALVTNPGKTLVADFTDMDVLVQYTDGGNSKVVSRLTYSSGWTISMNPDDRTPDIWNTGETAIISFTLGSAPKSNARGTMIVATPQGMVDSSYFMCVCDAGNTGYNDASAQAADTGGNNDGFEVNPSNAFSDDAAFTENINGNGDRHRFYNYEISAKGSCDVIGIEVRLDWWLDNLGGSNSLDVELSWYGGSSCTAANSDTLESTTEHTAILGGASDTWGRTWAVSDFDESNFRLRVTANGVGGRNHYLDWAPVKVYYAPS